MGNKDSAEDIITTLIAQVVSTQIRSDHLYSLRIFL